MNIEPIELVDEGIKVSWNYTGETSERTNLFGKPLPVLRLNVYQQKGEDWELIHSVRTSVWANARFNERYKSLAYMLFHHNLARRLQLLSVSESWRGIAFSPFYIKLNFH